MKIIRIFMYDGTEAEMNRIIAEQAAEGYTLVEIKNVVEGNFLAFVNIPELNTFVTQ